MTLTRKDLYAAVLTTLVVLTFAATHEGWGVPLVGDSRRWATGAILLLGAGTCGLGTKVTGTLMTVFALLGTLTLLLAAVALVTASLTALSLLVVCIVFLFVIATVRHTVRPPTHRLATP
jgi:peptidoglycan/LPS O-acetylase OafA/YrhL